MSGYQHSVIRRVMGALGIAALVLFAAVPSGNAAQAAATTVAFLGVHLQNDNEAFEPTTDAERGRMAALETAFTQQLEASGRYKFLPISTADKSSIAAGQVIGECGGCELQYGRTTGANQVAWISVQKISNLILNLNVYMADGETGRRTFQHSVDIRGNTDETWSRSLTYLVRNYLLDDQSTG